MPPPPSDHMRQASNQGQRQAMPTDTLVDAEQVQLRLLKDKSPSERLGLVLRLSSEVIRASKRAISRAHNEWTEREVGLLFVELYYGRELAEAMRRYEETRNDAQSE